MRTSGRGCVIRIAYSHLAVSVADLERSREFYTQVLGFETGPVYRSAGRRVAGLMESSATSFTGVFLRLGDVLVELLEYDPSRAPARSPRRADEHGYAHVSLVVDDVEAVLAAASAHGGTVRTRFEHTFADGRTAIAFLTDPDGNRIELIAHTTAGERDAHGAYLGLTGLGWPAGERSSPDPETGA
jgi:catechol 2,3-dioxygenase-like lactoylglutathione lyase family enzyme